MPKKENDILYEKILRDVDRYISGSDDAVIHTDSNGIQTETTFMAPPTPQEIESLLIWLNKERIAQA
jgi:hypothetical protein